MAEHSWYVLSATGERRELHTYDDRETAIATAFALLREARQVIEVGPVRGPVEAVINEAELRRMMTELPPAPRG